MRSATGTCPSAIIASAAAFCTGVEFAAPTIVSSR